MMDNSPTQHRPSRDQNPDPSEQALARIGQLLEQANTLQEAGHTGRALGTLSKAMTIADSTQWLDPDDAHTRIMLRHRAAEMAQDRGDLIEAISQVDDLIRIRGELFGLQHKTTFQSKGWYADLLLEVGRNEEAFRAYSEIREWAESARGTPLSRVASNIGCARALVSLKRHDEAEDALARAGAALEEVPTESYQALSNNLRVQSTSFAHIGRFEIALELAELSTEYLKRSGKYVNREQINESQLHLAHVAGCKGDYKRASEVRCEVLAKIEEEHGKSSPQAFSLRSIMAEAAYECGRFADAEVLLKENARIASMKPTERSATHWLLKLRDFYHETAKPKAAGLVAALVERARRSAEKNKREVADAEEGSTDTPLDGRARLVRGLEALVESAEEILDASGAGSRYRRAVDALNECVIELPDETKQRLTDRLDIVAERLAKEPTELFEVISKRLQRIEKLELVHGESRKVTHAGQLAGLAGLLKRAGDVYSARVQMRLARKLLEEVGLKDSSLYAHFLMSNSTLFSKDSPMRARMASAAKKLYDRHREE